MIALLIAFSLLHLVFYVVLLMGWKQVPTARENTSSNQNFSVVVAARNEEENITKLLSQLASQDYPQDAFEVIIVDDFSEDRTYELVKSFMSTTSVQIRVVSLEERTMQGKKHAITKGVREARFPLILTTDADCSLKPRWIATYNQAFQTKTQMVTGPVVLAGNGFFEKLQQIEFAGLMGFGAVALENGNPTVCSGANLGFRKAAFEQVGGYSDNLFIPSGDDEFLMHGIFEQHPTGIVFLKDQQSIVTTDAKSSLTALVNQRVRWVSKWRFNRNKWVRAFSVLFFFDFLIYLLAILSAIVVLVPFFPVLLCFSLRILVEFLFIRSLNAFLDRKTSLLIIGALQIFYPVHVLFMGLKSIFGSYTWKGRKYG